MYTEGSSKSSSNFLRILLFSLGFVALGIVVNVALYTSNVSKLNTENRQVSDFVPVFKDMCDLPVGKNWTDIQPDCSLDCGPCGICVLAGRESQPTCLCHEAYATFPLDCDELTRQCENVYDAETNSTITVCSCESTNRRSKGELLYYYPCGYQKTTRWRAFVVSFLAGIFGGDWFYLYRQGKGGYIAAGIFKLLTGGGGTIWATVDWVRIAASKTSFLDGNGFELTDWGVK